MTQLADLNDDCTLSLLKQFSSAQLFTFISRSQFSSQRLRHCAMVALKAVYAPFSLNSSFGRDGEQFIYVADINNAKVAVVKRPHLFQHWPLSGFLEKAEIQLSADFGPEHLQAWFDVAQAIVISQLQLSLSYSYDETPPRGPLVRQLLQAFSAARSLCIDISPTNLSNRTLRGCRYLPAGGRNAREEVDLLDAIGMGLMQTSLRNLEIVSHPAPYIPMKLSSYLKLRLLFSRYLPRSTALESADFRGIFLQLTPWFPAPSPGVDPHTCELLLYDMLANLNANSALKCIKLRSHIESISKLQAKVPEGCKIVELNGEPVLNEEILKRMHSSPEKVVIVQETQQGMDEEGQAEKLYLHIDCAPPVPI